MSAFQSAGLVSFLRTEYRAIVVQELAVDWRCPSWIAKASCSDLVQATPGMCRACPVRAECLVTAMVLDDPAPLRGGLSREARTAAFIGIEQDAFGLDDWLRGRSSELGTVP